MINPLRHGATAAEIATYNVEPYVVAADVYAVAPHTGRGGWTWYTGSAGWMYRLISESVLGLHLEVDKLHIAPCIPPGWSSYKINYRFRETAYSITIHNHGLGLAVDRIVLDGIEQGGPFIALVDDRTDHNVVVYIGSQF